jgi:uncharacterized protein
MSTINLFYEESVSWIVDEIEIQATLTRPVGEGPFPAVIFVAGSGPTDRDWNTPLLPGTNGSGALLARVLSEQGFITLRYDKRASGPHVLDNVKRMAGKISMQSHVAELSGGVNLLASDRDVNLARIFTLTNSEGCVHALNYQTQNENLPFAGMVLTSAFARPTGELAHSQIAAQLETVPGRDALLSAYDAAMDDFIADRPVSISEILPESLKQVIQAITQPVNLPFSRELWVFNPVTMLTEVSAPILIVIGKKDIQVDWQTDGSIFEAYAREHDNVAIFYSENANHVLKFEPKPRSQLTAAEVMAAYNAEEMDLDPEPVQTILSWLRAHL